VANPQIEDGHVRIANEIVDQLSRINLSPYESRVLWAIWRKTYGWHKKSDRISYTQFQQMTGLDRWHIARTIKRLKARNIIAISGNKHKLIYSFQKDYNKWLPLPVEATKTLKVLPVEATKPLPVEATKVGKLNVACRGNTPLPIEATSLLPVEANTKTKNTYTKTKELPFTLVKGFGELKYELTKLANKREKVAFLIDSFKFYHSNAPPDDLENSGGRIAGILKSISYDYGYLLKLIWDSSSVDIAGSHLNYIQGMIRKGKKTEPSRLSTDDEIRRSIEG